MNRDMVRYLLEHRLTLPQSDFTVQGFGFMRLRVSPRIRVHVWHSSLRVPNVSDIHDHAQWAFKSTVMAGQIINVRFSEIYNPGGERYLRGVIHCGQGGGPAQEPPVPTDLIPQRPEAYEAGDSYRQEPNEVHRTYAADGTVTVIEQWRTETDTAHVYWPANTPWVDAIPRQATYEEIDRIGAAALAIFVP